MAVCISCVHLGAQQTKFFPFEYEKTENGERGVMYPVDDKKYEKALENDTTGKRVGNYD